MHTKFALDLKVARRKSGLTQQDCAHLLDIQRSKMSKMEAGKRLPTVLEICTLSLIYGKSFESLFGSAFNEARSSLKHNLSTMPASRAKWGRLNRNHTLNAIAHRLQAHEPTGHGRA